MRSPIDHVLLQRWAYIRHAASFSDQNANSCWLSAMAAVEDPQKSRSFDRKKLQSIRVVAIKKVRGSGQAEWDSECGRTPPILPRPSFCQHLLQY